MKSNFEKRLDSLGARLAYLELIASGAMGDDLDAAEYWQGEAQAAEERAAGAESVLFDVLAFLAFNLCTCLVDEVARPCPAEHATACYYRSQCKRLGVPYHFAAGWPGRTVYVLNRRG